jgi:hypothetical protein
MREAHILGWECGAQLYIRFENAYDTDALLLPELFHAALPYTMSWDSEQYAWRLTLHAIQDVSLLAHRYLGERSFTYLGVGLL